MITNCISATAMILLTNHVSFLPYSKYYQVKTGSPLACRSVLGVMLSTAGIDIPGLAVLFYCRAAVLCTEIGKGTSGTGLSSSMARLTLPGTCPWLIVVSKRQNKSLEIPC